MKSKTHPGSSLVSENLPLRKFKRSTSAPAVAALSFSTGTMDGINVIIDNIGNLLDNATDVTEAQAALSGGESQADLVMRLLRDDILPTNNVTVEAIDRIDMSFGIYGNVPLIYVRFTDSYVLIDGVDGTMSQVFDLTSPLDGRALLERYTDFQGDDSVRYFNKFGCVMQVAPTWRDTPPVPGIVPTPGPPGTPAGLWQPWQCSAQGHTCRCTASGTYQDPGPPVVPYTVRVICSFCSATGTNNCTTPTTPGTPAPAPTPATPGTPVPYTGCSCKFQYMY